MNDENQTVEQIIEEREKTVGNFTNQSAFIEATLQIWMRTLNWNRMLPYQKQSLRMLLHKVGRILVGDHMHLDHWVDAEGYIHLTVQRLQAQPPQPHEPDYPGTPEDGGQHAQID